MESAAHIVKELRHPLAVVVAQGQEIEIAVAIIIAPDGRTVAETREGGSHSAKANCTAGGLGRAHRKLPLDRHKRIVIDAAHRRRRTDPHHLALLEGALRRKGQPPQRAAIAKRTIVVAAQVAVDGKGATGHGTGCQFVGESHDNDGIGCHVLGLGQRRDQAQWHRTHHLTLAFGAVVAGRQIIGLLHLCPGDQIATPIGRRQAQGDLRRHTHVQPRVAHRHLFPVQTAIAAQRNLTTFAARISRQRHIEFHIAGRMWAMSGQRHGIGQRTVGKRRVAHRPQADRQVTDRLDGGQERLTCVVRWCALIHGCHHSRHADDARCCRRRRSQGNWFDSANRKRRITRHRLPTGHLAGRATGDLTAANR